MLDGNKSSNYADREPHANNGSSSPHVRHVPLAGLRGSTAFVDLLVTFEKRQQRSIVTLHWKHTSIANVAVVRKHITAISFIDKILWDRRPLRESCY